MPVIFPETELIITPDKRVYHLNVNGDHLANNILLVGDPDRVAKVSRHFSNIEFKTQHREFITHTGTYKGKRISVISTGIGTDNIDIVLNEIDAAVNIDLEKRVLKDVSRKLNLIRLGTSGALQEEIPVDHIVVSTHGLGLDGLINYYDFPENLLENDISKAVMQHCNWPQGLPFPYCVKADSFLFDVFAKDNFSGITATAPGFYGPQGRNIRLKSRINDFQNLLGSFRYQQHKVTNFEMETSALYGLGAALGHNCLTACVIIANRIRKEYSSNTTKSVEQLIENSLERILSLPD